MAQALNLVGQRFGYLTVVERSQNNKNGNTMWKCKCDCGNTKIALGYDLTHGRTTTCGCKIYITQKPPKRALIGKRFGKLFVESADESRKAKNNEFYLCRCDCGALVSVSAANLRRGQKSHSGCPIKEPKYTDLTGRKFGRLLVESYVGRKGTDTQWLCRCDCGNSKIVNGHYLTGGRTKSCGCLLRENQAIQIKKLHEKRKVLYDTPHRKRIYKAFASMHTRCKPSYHNHTSYYDKGVRVCDEWCGKGAFDRFLKWALNNGYDESLSLDRIDVNGGYSPDNCRWITMKAQQNNRGNNVYITIGSETKTMKEWSDYFNVDYSVVKARHQRGWGTDRLFEPKNK